MEKDYGFFEEPESDDINEEEMNSLIDQEAVVISEEQLRLTHVSLRHQLLDKAKAFISECGQWKSKPLKQKLAELQVTYRLMTKLTEDE